MTHPKRRNGPRCTWATAATVLALAALLAPAPVRGEAAEADGLIGSPEPGWPQWRGPRRDAVSEETGLLPTWPPEGLRCLWKVDGLGRGWSSPIIVNGALYVTGDVGEDLVIYAFGLDGRPKWNVTNGKAWKRSFPGARACPTWSEGMLYHVNGHGRLAALDAVTGKEHWADNILRRFGARNITWGIAECLLVHGEHLFVTPAGPQTAMAALEKTTGRTVWTSEPISGDEATYCSPILFRQDGRRLLVNCSSHHMFGADAETGKLLWTVPLHNRHSVTTATPIYGEGCVFGVAPDGAEGACYRLRVDGDDVRVTLAWRSPIDTLTGGGVLVADTLYASGCKTSQSLHAIDWTSGETRYAAQLTDGQARWASSAMVWAEGRLYCLLDDGAVVMLAPKSEGYDVLGRFQLVEPKRRDAWAHPVLLNGRLYLRYHDTLWCYDVRGG